MSLRDRGAAAPLLRPAVGVLVVAVLLLLWSASRLVRAGTVPDDPLPRNVLAVPSVTLPAPDVARARPLDDDPFSPDREPPARRYTLPSEESDDADAAPSARPTLVGTAVPSDGEGFATARLGDALPKILHVGDRLGPYTLRAVDRGRATFVGPDGEEFEVRAVPPPVSK